MMHLLSASSGRLYGAATTVRSTPVDDSEEDDSVDLPRRAGGAGSGVRFSNALPASARVAAAPARAAASVQGSGGGGVTFSNALPRVR
jgi:hypothetical protein